MSRLKTKQAFLDHLLANLPTGITDDDVAFENQKPPFRPKGKVLWLDTHIIEASSDTTGKDITDSDLQRGFFQVDVRVPLVDSMNDNQLMFTVDELASVFRFGTKLVYNGQTVSILNNDTSNSNEDGAWYRRMITINYLTISER